MFTDISWGNYCIAIGLLVLVWYVFLGFRFYDQEFREFFSGKLRLNIAGLSNKNRQRSFLDTNDEIILESSFSAASSQSISIIEDVEELSSILKNAINESAERALSKEEFRNYLQLILADFSFVKDSTFRIKVNELMVSECERHPQKILTYAEVDDLWDEAI